MVLHTNIFTLEDFFNELLVGSFLTKDNDSFNEAEYSKRPLLFHTQNY